MKPTVTPEIKEIMEAVHYRPAVSMIMPFDPGRSSKTQLHHSLETAADKVERELLENYPAELKMLVMQKIRAIIKNLNFDTHQKSIAIYASPVFEKVLYLDIPVEERIIIDESFEIRDLVYGKKQIHKYLLLHISGKQSSLYLGNSETFIKIVSDSPDSAQAYVNDAPERVANFSDTQQRKQIDIEKFLRHTDNALDLILHAYHLPLFVMGAEKVLGHFKKITKHNSSIIEYIHGNYEEATLSQLNDVVGPF
ncbi:MAG TPA: hypothetical protein VFV68_09455, partial [Agriterribacter sp.]|nr:hypothetical protein [Agriterribacter sp.]